MLRHIILTFMKTEDKYLESSQKEKISPIGKCLFEWHQSSHLKLWRPEKIDTNFSSAEMKELLIVNILYDETILQEWRGIKTCAYEEKLKIHKHKTCC